jgi:rfaE bifunctional protein kinase chain/domain
MTPQRFSRITRAYRSLRIAVVGDYCLDRYLELRPRHKERSIETRLPVHQVMGIRSQPGGAGTIVNNLSALGIGAIHCVGFCGEDGEGYELVRALQRVRGVHLDGFLQTPSRCTFTYTKPMLAGHELSRLDMKNWTPTPRKVEAAILDAVHSLADRVDAIIALEQTDIAGTGVLTPRIVAALGKSGIPVLADSRRDVTAFRGAMLKMNRAEFRHNFGSPTTPRMIEAARKTGHALFVTAAGRGITAALPDGTCAHSPAFPVAGEIDVVGAGDSVSANLTAALAAGASIEEALALANAAASVVVHKLGTTGTASIPELRAKLQPVR